MVAQEASRRGRRLCKPLSKDSGKTAIWVQGENGAVLREAIEKAVRGFVKFSTIDKRLAYAKRYPHEEVSQETADSPPSATIVWSPDSSRKVSIGSVTPAFNSQKGRGK